MTKILDCTFRDGGYQTNWNFDVDLAARYISLIHKFGVSIVEIGFRSKVTSENQDAGPFLFSNEDFLARLSLPIDMKIAVMINADEISNVASDIDALFSSASECRVSIVRIAARLDSIAKCKDIAFLLHQKGYEVALNLMQATPKLLESDMFQRNIEIFNEFDYLFLADSFGVLSPSDITSMDKIMKGSNLSYGLHLHDNRGLAYANSLAARDLGIEWIDATAMGIGRGAGNLRISQLIIDKCNQSELNSREFKELLVVIKMLIPSDLQAGISKLDILYILGAKYNVHPNKVLELIQGSNIEYAIQTLTSDGVSNID